MQRLHWLLLLTTAAILPPAAAQVSSATDYNRDGTCGNECKPMSNNEDCNCDASCIDKCKICDAQGALSTDSSCLESNFCCTDVPLACGTNNAAFCSPAPTKTPSAAPAAPTPAPTGPPVAAAAPPPTPAPPTPSPTANATASDSDCCCKDDLFGSGNDEGCSTAENDDDCCCDDVLSVRVSSFYAAAMVAFLVLGCCCSSCICAFAICYVARRAWPRAPRQKKEKPAKVAPAKKEAPAPKKPPVKPPQKKKKKAVVPDEEPAAPVDDGKPKPHEPMEDRLKKVQALLKQRLQPPLYLVEVDLVPGMRLRLKDTINFRAGTAVILPSSDMVLDELVRACKALSDIAAEFKLPKIHLRVEGHVHQTADEEKCERLSWERPKVVARRVAMGGTPMELLHPQGFGYSRPLGSAHANRRVEVHLMNHKQVIREALRRMALMEARSRRGSGSGSGSGSDDEHEDSSWLSCLQDAVVHDVGEKCPNLRVELTHRRVAWDGQFKFAKGKASYSKGKAAAVVGEIGVLVASLQKHLSGAKLHPLHLELTAFVKKDEDDAESNTRAGYEALAQLSRERADKLCADIAAAAWGDGAGTHMSHVVLHPKEAVVPQKPRVEVRVVTRSELMAIEQHEQEQAASKIQQQIRARNSARGGTGAALMRKASRGHIAATAISKKKRKGNKAGKDNEAPEVQELRKQLEASGAGARPKQRGASPVRKSKTKPPAEDVGASAKAKAKPKPKPKAKEKEKAKAKAKAKDSAGSTAKATAKPKAKPKAKAKAKAPAAVEGAASPPGGEGKQKSPPAKKPAAA